MDQKRNLTTTIGVVLLLAVSFIFIAQSIVNAEKVCRLEDLRIVRITQQSEGDGTPTVEPRALDITSGDCVVWVNWSKDDEVMVVFSDGKACYDVTRQASSGFSMKSQQNCYVTNFIPYGGTSSLTFKDNGVFEYEVIAENGKSTKCKLIVHEKKTEAKK